MRIILSALTISTLLIARGFAQDVRPSTSTDAVSGVLDAFRTHTIVALGEGSHGNEQGAAFRLALIRDPRFATAVNDIVVESGNARYQDVIDRFVHDEKVPDLELRRVWQNTTQPHTLWDVPIYEEFFRAVRDVNTRLPRDRHLRVLLADSPIDWDSVKSAEDFKAWLANPISDRDRFPAELIQREVVDRRRRALVIYGDLHLNRKAVLPRADASDGSNNIVDRLERAGAKVFAIHTATRADLAKLQSSIAAWPKPSLALLRGTTLGAADLSTYYPAPSLLGADGKPKYPRPMEQQFDAVLYLGSPKEITPSRLSPSLCADAEYLTMRRARIAMAGGPKDLDRLNEQCPAPGTLAR
jgi:hypothetical protein